MLYIHGHDPPSAGHEEFPMAPVGVLLERFQSF